MNRHVCNACQVQFSYRTILDQIPWDFHRIVGDQLLIVLIVSSDYHISWYIRKKILVISMQKPGFIFFWGGGGVRIPAVYTRPILSNVSTWVLSFHAISITSWTQKMLNYTLLFVKSEQWSVATSCIMNSNMENKIDVKNPRFTVWTVWIMEHCHIMFKK